MVNKRPTIRSKTVSRNRMPQRYTNESKGKYQVLRATKWSKGVKGLEKPVRLILISFGHIRVQGIPMEELAIRWQDKNKGATFGGGSLLDRKEAERTFMQEYHDHNAKFGPGNPSHLPGIIR